MMNLPTRALPHPPCGLVPKSTVLHPPHCCSLFFGSTTTHIMQYTETKITKKIFAQYVMKLRVFLLIYILIFQNENIYFITCL